MSCTENPVTITDNNTTATFVVFPFSQLGISVDLVAN